ncbi:hypothetical protein ACQU0X_26590 [Pseudovibrio ascidiaceicola]|uniref:hypothetical protein n=1 Tax=Pseudovibrio ascidiaceicola TaxID=285279 RepID=UPI003D361205
MISAWHLDAHTGVLQELQTQADKFHSLSSRIFAGKPFDEDVVRSLGSSHFQLMARVDPYAYLDCNTITDLGSSCGHKKLLNNGLFYVVDRRSKQFADNDKLGFIAKVAEEVVNNIKKELVIVSLTSIEKQQLRSAVERQFQAEEPAYAYGR